MAEEAQTEKSESGKASAPPAASRPRKQRKIIFAVLLLVILIFAAFCLYRSVWQTTDDAYVHGNQIVLMPRISGTVASINADETDLVRKGQAVVVLDDSDAKVSLQLAESVLGDTLRKVRQYYANVEQLNANVNASKIALTRAEDDNRRRISAGHGTVSIEDITHSQQALDAANAALEAVEQQLIGAKALVANVDLKHHPLVLQSQANVINAELALLRTTITAPETGYVIRRNVQVGQQVAPGTAMLIIVPLNQIWVDANFKEKELRFARIGQPVSLKSDFYGDSAEYKGHVEGLAPSTGAAFSLLPPDEGSGNWIKIVQRVPVRIVLDAKQLEKYPLRIGLSMRVTIDTENHGGAVLTQVSSTQSVYATDIYSNEWIQANELLRGLVATNLQALSSLASDSAATTVRKKNNMEMTHE